MPQWDSKTILEPYKPVPRDKSLIGLGNQKKSNQSFVYGLRNENVHDDPKRIRRIGSTSSFQNTSKMYEDTDCRSRRTDSVERILNQDMEKKLQ